MLSRRAYISEGFATLTQGTRSHKRYLLLFEDWLIIVKYRSNDAFQLKQRIKVSDLWISARLDLFIQGPNDKFDSSFIIGWPIVNHLITFSNPHLKTQWFHLFNTAIQNQSQNVRMDDEKITLKIFNSNLDTPIKSKAIRISMATTASECLEQCKTLFHLTSPEKTKSATINTSTNINDNPHPCYKFKDPNLVDEHTPNTNDTSSAISSTTLNYSQNNFPQYYLWVDVNTQLFNMQQHQQSHYLSTSSNSSVKSFKLLGHERPLVIISYLLSFSSPQQQTNTTGFNSYTGLTSDNNIHNMANIGFDDSLHLFGGFNGGLFGFSNLDNAETNFGEEYAQTHNSSDINWKGCRNTTPSLPNNNSVTNAQDETSSNCSRNLSIAAVSETRSMSSRSEHSSTLNSKTISKFLKDIGFIGNDYCKTKKPNLKSENSTPSGERNLKTPHRLLHGTQSLLTNTYSSPKETTLFNNNQHYHRTCDDFTNNESTTMQIQQMLEGNLGSALICQFSIRSECDASNKGQTTYDITTSTPKSVMNMINPKHTGTKLLKSRTLDATKSATLSIQKFKPGKLMSGKSKNGMYHIRKSSHKIGNLVIPHFMVSKTDSSSTLPNFSTKGVSSQTIPQQSSTIRPLLNHQNSLPVDVIDGKYQCANNGHIHRATEIRISKRYDGQYSRSGQTKNNQAITSYRSHNPLHLGNMNGEKRLFGKHLQEIVIKGEWPNPIQKILQLLYAFAPHTIGIFRKSANAKLCKTVREKLDCGVQIVLEDMPILVIAAIYKEFIRNIPNGLMDCQIYDKWRQTCNISNPDEKLFMCSNIFNQLTDLNRRLLAHTLHILNKIHSNASFNRMTALNLAICIGPSMLWSMSSPEKTPTSLSNPCLIKKSAASYHKSIKNTLSSAFVNKDSENSFTPSATNKKKCRSFLALNQQPDILTVQNVDNLESNDECIGDTAKWIASLIEFLILNIDALDKEKVHTLIPELKISKNSTLQRKLSKSNSNCSNQTRNRVKRRTRVSNASNVSKRRNSHHDTLTLSNANKGTKQDSIPKDDISKDQSSQGNESDIEEECPSQSSSPNSVSSLPTNLSNLPLKTPQSIYNKAFQNSTNIPRDKIDIRSNRNFALSNPSFSTCIKHSDTESAESTSPYNKDNEMDEYNVDGDDRCDETSVESLEVTEKNDLYMFSTRYLPYRYYSLNKGTSLSKQLQSQLKPSLPVTSNVRHHLSPNFDDTITGDGRFKTLASHDKMDENSSYSNTDGGLHGLDITNRNHYHATLGDKHAAYDTISICTTTKNKTDTHTHCHPFMSQVSPLTSSSRDSGLTLSDSNLYNTEPELDIIHRIVTNVSSSHSPNTTESIYSDKHSSQRSADIDYKPDVTPKCQTGKTMNTSHDNDYSITNGIVFKALQTWEANNQTRRNCSLKNTQPNPIKNTQPNPITKKSTTPNGATKQKTPYYNKFNEPCVNGRKLYEKSLKLYLNHDDENGNTPEGEKISNVQGQHISNIFSSQSPSITPPCGNYKMSLQDELNETTWSVSELTKLFSNMSAPTNLNPPDALVKESGLRPQKPSVKPKPRIIENPTFQIRI